MEARNQVGAGRRRDLTLHVEFRLITHFVDNSLIVAPLDQHGDPPRETGLMDRDDLISPVCKLVGDKSPVVLGFERRSSSIALSAGRIVWQRIGMTVPLRECSLRRETWTRFSTMRDFTNREPGEMKAPQRAIQEVPD